MKRLRVLLVDDSRVLRSRLREMLRRTRGVRLAREVGTVADAISALPVIHPDVVILDLSLPDGYGADVLKACAGLAWHPHVVILTNYAYPELRHAYLAAGAEVFLDKMTELERLPDVLRGIGAAGKST